MSETKAQALRGRRRLLVTLIIAASFPTCFLIWVAWMFVHEGNAASRADTLLDKVLELCVYIGIIVSIGYFNYIVYKGKQNAVGYWRLITLLIGIICCIFGMVPLASLLFDSHYDPAIFLLVLGILYLWLSFNIRFDKKIQAFFAHGGNFKLDELDELINKIGDEEG